MQVWQPLDNNGVVTAVANGNATITAAALDGSGKYAECSVVVEIPKENNQVVELAGGESKILSIWNEDYTENIDVTQVTFEYNTQLDLFSNLGYDVRTGKYIKNDNKGAETRLMHYFS